jgi:hypothetical protein
VSRVLVRRSIQNYMFGAELCLPHVGFLLAHDVMTEMSLSVYIFVYIFVFI